MYIVLYSSIDDADNQDVITTYHHHTDSVEIFWLDEQLDDDIATYSTIHSFAANELSRSKVKELREHPEGDKLTAAIDREVGNWRSNDVFEEYNVPDGGVPENIPIYGMRWVFEFKPDKGKGIEYKGRVILQGNQYDTDDNDYCATPSARTYRMFFVLAISLGFKLVQVDFTTAFLQSEECTELILAKPVPEFGIPEGKLIRIKKYAYGLRNASKRFVQKVTRKLESDGYSQSPWDPMLFVKIVDGIIVSLIVLHIDDIILAAKGKHLDDAIVILNSFKISKIAHVDEGVTVKHIGMHFSLCIHNGDLSIIMHQKDYLKKIAPLKIPITTDKATILGPNEVTEVKRVLGSLQYAVTLTRPDLSAQVSLTSQKVTTMMIKDMNQVENLRKEAAIRDYQIQFTSLKLDGRSENETITLIVLHDSAFQNCVDSNSQGGYLVFMCKETTIDNKTYTEFKILDFSNGVEASQFYIANLIHWRSYKSKRVCRSTLGAEILSALVSYDECVTIKETLQFFGFKVKLYMLSDCKSYIDALKKGVCIEKRLIADLNAIREGIKRGDIDAIYHLQGTKNLSDELTKELKIKLLLLLLENPLIGIPKRRVPM